MGSTRHIRRTGLIAAALLLLVAVLMFSCAGPKPSLYPARNCSELKTIYIVSHGWHTGFVIDAGDVSGYLDEVARDFDGAAYIEFGWGDRGFYQAGEISAGLTLQALLWPTDSVMHVVGLTASPVAAFPNSEVLEVQISGRGYRHLLEFIDHSFMKHSGKIIRQQNGLYGWSHFYQGRDAYHLFRTCNHWVAKGLRSTGFPITPLYAATAGNVLFQTERYAFPPLSCE